MLVIRQYAPKCPACGRLTLENIDPTTLAGASAANTATTVYCRCGTMYDNLGNFSMNRKAPNK